MKIALPENAKIAKEAKECMQECVSEFISFITSEGWKHILLFELRLNCATNILELRQLLKSVSRKSGRPSTARISCSL